MPVTFHHEPSVLAFITSVWVSCVAVLALFGAFLFFGLRVAMRCPDRFGSLLAGGITCMIGVQCVLNVAVVIGMMPTTGLPLPFFSAGGTSLSITMAAVGIYSMKGKLRSLTMSVTNIPLTNPDIVTGVSLALLFAFVGQLLKLNAILGFFTLLIAHVTFNLPYVILSVLPKLGQMDPNLRDAALDLGCTPVQAFFKVVIHEIMPGIISGALMAFTMSLDDFVISYFVYGATFVTLPVEIYNYTKKPIPSKIYALFTLLFAVILLLMVVMNLLQAGDERRAKARKSKEEAN